MSNIYWSIYTVVLLFLTVCCKRRIDVTNESNNINILQKESEIIIQPKKVAKEVSFCKVLDSLMKKTSSIPYNSYQGTPYLKVSKSQKEKEIDYHYFEDYPEEDEEGFDNGGKITLRNIILRTIDFDKLYVESKNNKIEVDTKKIVEISKNIFIINIREYFADNKDPFYEDKIDFKLKFTGVKKILPPVLVGVYWADLEDYYIEKPCKI